jgi:uncharacterized protein YbaR (Trm112 family)
MQSGVIELLACPACRHRLELQDRSAAATAEIRTARLDCSGCRRTFRVRDGIAELLIEAPPLTPAQIINRLTPTAWAYERVWRPYALSRLSGSPFPADEELQIVEVLFVAVGVAQEGFLKREIVGAHRDMLQLLIAVGVGDREQNR